MNKKYVTYYIDKIDKKKWKNFKDVSFNPGNLKRVIECLIYNVADMGLKKGHRFTEGLYKKYKKIIENGEK